MVSELIPEDGQLSLVLSSPHSESTAQNQGGRSTCKNNRLDSPLQQRLRDFDSEPAGGNGDQQMQLLSLTCSAPKPSSYPPSPGRQTPGLGALHDVQLGPFEFMASRARDEVIITQVDPLDDAPRPLLPTYSSQSATYTQPLYAPEFKQLLPDYSSQAAHEAAHRDVEAGETDPGLSRPPVEVQRPDRQSGPKNTRRYTDSSDSDVNMEEEGEDEDPRETRIPASAGSEGIGGRNPHVAQSMGGEPSHAYAS